MTAAEKNGILSLPCIAYYSGFAGIEIKNIGYAYGETYIIYVAGAWCSNKTVHRTRVYYNLNGNAYILYKGVRISLNECIRTDYNFN